MNLIQSPMDDSALPDEHPNPGVREGATSRPASQLRWTEELSILCEATRLLEDSFDACPSFDVDWDAGAMRHVLTELAGELADNDPYFHPLYAGQMLKPPHPVARMAWALSLFINANNHALDGGRATSRLEKSCIRSLGRLFGWTDPLGHLTGGGTVANLEALWVARERQPDRRAIVASEEAHYTHRRMAGLLGVPFVPVPVDARGRMQMVALDAALERHDVGVVVATVGTTGWGATDPVDEILRRRERHGFRLHADAAYGGYFSLVSEHFEPPTRKAFEALRDCDSIVIDPHKHGLQPYGSGAVLFRRPEDARVYAHDSPYTYYTASGGHLGEISLECSRPGAAAAALWCTLRLFPLEPGGVFAKQLWTGCSAARDLADDLAHDSKWTILNAPELDILVFSARARSVREAGRLNRRIFEEARRQGLYLALFEAPSHRLLSTQPAIEMDQPTVSVLRSCLMKPEHRGWRGEYVLRLEAAWTGSREVTNANRTP